MNDIVHNFEISHHELKKLVDEIRIADFKSEEGRLVLMSSKEFILSHFSIVCAEHCPDLAKLAKVDPPLSRIIKIFSADMKLILQAIKEFFSRYERAEHSLEYAAEYGRIYALIVHSVHKQTTVLHMFERLEGRGEARRDSAISA